MYSTSYLMQSQRSSLASSFRGSPYYPQDPANLRGKVPSWGLRPGSAGPRPASPAATQAVATRHAAAARLTRAFLARDLSPAAFGPSRGNPDGLVQRRGFVSPGELPAILAEARVTLAPEQLLRARRMFTRSGTFIWRDFVLDFRFGSDGVGVVPQSALRKHQPTMAEMDSMTRRPRSAAHPQLRPVQRPSTAPSLRKAPISYAERRKKFVQVEDTALDTAGYRL